MTAKLQFCHAAPRQGVSRAWPVLVCRGARRASFRASRCAGSAGRFAERMRFRAMSWQSPHASGMAPFATHAVVRPGTGKYEPVFDADAGRGRDPDRGAVLAGPGKRVDHAADGGACDRRPGAGAVAARYPVARVSRQAASRTPCGPTKGAWPECSNLDCVHRHMPWASVCACHGPASLCQGAPLFLADGVRCA